MKTYSNTPRGERLIPVVCDLCGSPDYRPHWNCGTFSYVRCRGCGVVYQNPQPFRDELLQRYDDAYFSYEIENEKKFFQLMLYGLRDIRFEQLESSLPPDQRSFLDIGCATGLLLDHLRHREWDVRGVEICRPSAQFGIQERGLDIQIGTLEEARFPDGRFDVVHFSHLIEHLNSPGIFLDEVARILKPGGWVLVTTPNTQGFQAQLFQQNWRSAIADHLYLFSRRNLRQALSRRGLMVKRTKTWGGLALGARPRFLKPVLDRAVKWLGWGDVVLFAAQKAESSELSWPTNS